MSTPRISTSPGAGTPGGWFWKPEWDSDSREGLIKAEIPPGGNMHTGPKVDTAVGGWMRRRAAVQPHGGILRSREQERGPDTAARGRTLNPRRSETEAHAEGCTAGDPVEGKRPEPAHPTTESGFVDGDRERLLRTRPPAGPMAFVWIALFLTPASGLLLPDQDPSPPIRNVRMEPESQRLTWDLQGNVSGIECSQSLEYNVTARKNQYCQFPVLPSCGSKNYTVFVTGGQPFSTSIGYPEPEGNPGAAAQNLTCWVHDVDFLTCRWAVGSAAPRDVQYHLHVGEARTSEGRECPGYTADERGTHVRCRFDDLSGFSNRLYRFRVRGTSRASGIPCSEMFEQLSRIERLSPPNITGWCNKTYSLLEWEMSSRFSWKFTYELEIQQGASPADLVQVQDFETFYGMPNPGTYTVRIRARGYFTGIVSEWSAPKHFVCDPEEEGARLRVWLTASLTALGPLLALGLLVLICRKYSLMRKIFPPIPHMKDPLSDSLQNKLMIWEAGRDPREECPVAEVQVVGET